MSQVIPAHRQANGSIGNGNGNRERYGWDDDAKERTTKRVTAFCIRWWIHHLYSTSHHQIHSA